MPIRRRCARLSTYTTELRYICESLAGLDESVGYSDTDDVITAAAPLIFDFTYPIFEDDYKLGLEKKIIEHYYTREIGEETVGLWKMRLRAKMREIMPYYNQLYISALQTFDPFNDTDITTTHTLERAENGTVETSGANSGKSSGSSTTAGKSSTTQEQDYSDTPQGDATGVLDKKYLTSVTVENASGENSATQTTSGETSGTTSSEETRKASSTDEYIEKIAGKRGGASYSALLQEFRETFLNIDMEVVGELSDLFMNIW